MEAFTLHQKSPISKPPLLPTPRGGQAVGFQTGVSGLGPISKMSRSTYGASSSGSFASSMNKSSTQSFKPTRVISVTERANKIAKGLCYFCD